MCEDGGEEAGLEVGVRAGVRLLDQGQVAVQPEHEAQAVPTPLLRTTATSKVGFISFRADTAFIFHEPSSPASICTAKATIVGQRLIGVRGSEPERPRDWH